MPAPRSAVRVDDDWRGRIRRGLTTEPHRDQLPPDASAILVPVLEGPSGPALLFTLRHAALARHAGQWSFPGGRIEPQDKGPVDAALRETEEEIGLPPRHVRVLGHLDDYTTYYGRLICAYVGEVAPRAPAPRIAAPQEVAEVRVLPLRDFLAPERYEGRCLPEGAIRGSDRVVHYWHFEGATIWGITAELLARLLQRAYGWAPPSAPRVIGSVAEFRELARRGL
jgi:8-oxo-dGTP pyrophosphatase MutT (NUDIX family)